VVNSRTVARSRTLEHVQHGIIYRKPCSKGRMDLGELSEIRVILRLLKAFGCEKESPATMRDLCARTTLSIRSVERGMKALLLSSLVRKGNRGFGRPLSFVLSDRGTRAVRHVANLELLLATPASAGMSDSTFVLSPEAHAPGDRGPRSRGNP